MGGVRAPKEEASFIAENEKNKIEGYEKPYKYGMYSFLPEDEKKRVSITALEDTALSWFKQTPMYKQRLQSQLDGTGREAVENRLLESAKKILKIDDSPNQFGRQTSPSPLQTNTKNK